jgi:methionine-gamma-lyase
MERHHENGLAVAKFLAGHPAVQEVHHPGLEGFPGHEIAKKQMDGFPSVFSFELHGGLDSGRELLRHIRLCTLAVSLGTLDTLIQHPASMTHAKVPRELREKQGLTDGLVRISVGLESAEDLCADLGQALEKAAS